jgi:DNA-binding HxlR family transcriptional regulator
MDSLVDYSDCPIRFSIDILSSRWNVWLIQEISKGVVRPCDLQRTIHIAPKRVLTKSLSDLEKKGILKRKIYPVLPPKVEYYLTDAGKALIPIISQLWAWGDKYKDQISKVE